MYYSELAQHTLLESFLGQFRQTILLYVAVYCTVIANTNESDSCPLSCITSHHSSISSTHSVTISHHQALSPDTAISTFGFCLKSTFPELPYADTTFTRLELSRFSVGILDTVTDY